MFTISWPHAKQWNSAQILTRSHYILCQHEPCSLQKGTAVRFTHIRVDSQEQLSFRFVPLACHWEQIQHPLQLWMPPLWERDKRCTYQGKGLCTAWATVHRLQTRGLYSTLRQNVDALWWNILKLVLINHYQNVIYTEQSQGYMQLSIPSYPGLHTIVTSENHWGEKPRL